METAPSTLVTLHYDDRGAGTLSTSIAKPMSGWTKVSVTGITVTTGSIQVGVSADANAGNWVDVDDVSLVNAGAISNNGPARAK